MQNKELIDLITRASDKILAASVLLQEAGANRELAQCDMIMKHLANYRDGLERIDDGE